jgi:type I restriction enzyme R subunit
MVKLDAMLQKLFELLDIANLDEINEELRQILEEAKRINDENERLSARYEGNYAFVKTYTDAVEIHPEYAPEDIAEVLDVVYEAVKEIQSANILILQGRENFVSSVSNKTITKLIKKKLYMKLNLKDWYTTILTETYANMKIF